VIEVADRYGVSRQAVHSWLRRYRTGGLDALADRSHRPNTCPHQMPARSRPACASCAGAIQAGVSAASPTYICSVGLVIWRLALVRAGPEAAGRSLRSSAPADHRHVTSVTGRF
jgi:hypothetical protein